MGHWLFHDVKDEEEDREMEKQVSMLARLQFGSRRGIVMTTRSTHKFENLNPKLAAKLGVGYKWYGSEWTIWFPATKKDEEEITKSLTELKIPFKYVWALGPRYLEE